MPCDTACDGYDFAGWSVRGASVRGLSHRHYDEVRQDAYQVLYAGHTGRLAVAVCDGLGSAPQSHLAAAIAADGLCLGALAGHTPSGQVGQTDWISLFTDVSDRIAAAQTARFGPDADVMATTALVVVIDELNAPSTPGTWHATIAHVGDCSAWLRAPEHRWTRISGGKADAGPVRSNSVRSPLPFGRAERAVTVDRVTLGTGDLLLACSDGVGDPFGDGDQPVARTLAARWTQPPRPVNFAAHIGFGSKSWTDDRTGVAIWTPPE